MTGVVLRAGAATDVGRTRTINQDCFELLPDRNLFIVADGMGGHQGGEVASKLAVETLQVAYREPSADALTEAIAVANHRIRNEGDSDPALRGMGTTVVALALLPQEDDADDQAEPREHLVIANVGDSRAYLFRDGSLMQLTDDHSVVADLVREGQITSEEAEDHPQRNIVTRVLGVYETVEVDLWPVDPVEHDRYLLCSDGLFHEVGSEEISDVLARVEDPHAVATELVRLANEGGGHDNITVVIVDVVDDGGVAEAASAALAGEPSHLASPPADTPRPPHDDEVGPVERRAPSAAPDDDLTAAQPAVDVLGDDPTAVQPSAGAPEAEPDPSARGDAAGDVDHTATQAVLDAPSDDEIEGATPISRRERRAQRRAQRSRRTRFTWRVLLFILLVAGVIGGAFATIQWYGTSTYFVSFDDDEVVIYRGRPGGLLWIDPELVERTGIDRADVPERYVPPILAGNEQPSRAKVNQFIDNIERDMAQARDSTGSTDSSTTTSTPGSVTTRAAT